MTRSLSFAALLGAISSTAFAQGPIDTVLRGPYVCELPGDAAGRAGIPQPDRSFTIESSSRYTAPQGAGTYLRRGVRLDMTSGPRKGEAYLVVRPGFLRERQADGTPGRLRCVLQS
uniref:elongation factor P n=1 Tax=Altererythrobacter segetis TaxID=1104773 RepID=UPI00140E738F|nr:elongation factor P [Altererythrobacter segetis]